jgi:hypothetical protein
MGTAKSRIFLLFLYAMFGGQASAQQQAELIRNACTPQEYEAYVQDFVRSLQALVDAPPGAIPLGDLLTKDSRKVSPQCQQAFASLETITPPGAWRKCTPQQKQKMIASDTMAKWPLPLRADCRNF